MSDMETAIPEDEPIKLNELPYLLRPRLSGETLRFDSGEELASWVDAEVGMWSELFATENKAPFAGNFINHVQTGLNTLQTNARKLAEGTVDPNTLQRITSVLTEIQEGGIPLSSTPWVATALSIAEHDSDAATAMLILSVPKDRLDATGNIQNNSQSFFRGIVNGIQAHLSEGSVAQEKTLANLRRRWDGRYRQLHNREEKAAQSLENEIKRQKRIERSATSVFTTLRDSWEKDFGDAYSEHEQKMSDMQQAFSTKMELQASELFWKDKENNNRTRASTAREKFNKIAAGGLIAYLLYSGGVAVVFSELVAAFSPLSAAIFGVPLGLLIWVLRFYSQDYRTNLALADDAHERHSMVLAFKALEFDGLIPAEERLVVLQALFRPHGRPPEDTVPVPVWDAFITRIDPTKKS
jgi:hypothetical protein